MSDTPTPPAAEAAAEVEALASAPRDAYSLLSRPTLEITDEELEIIVADLRRRREYFVKEGKKDNPKAERAKAAKAPATKASKEAKERNTAVLLSELNLGDLTGRL